MSEENKKADDDSVELSTVLQLSPHTPTDKVSVVKGEEGQEYISLDETYEVTGQESLQILAANCREYMKNKRLHPSAFSVLKISGCEGLVPTYDRMNGVIGGESFLKALKNGFIAIIKAAKKFLIAVVDWIVLRVRTLLGFEKTERELAITAEHCDKVKEDIIGLLSSIVGVDRPNDFILPAELYEALDGNVTQREAFSIIQSKNRTAVEQVEALESIRSQLRDVENTIATSSSVAKESRSRYQHAVDRLRKAWTDNQEGFTDADVIEFRAVLDDELAVKLNPMPIYQELTKLIDKAYGIDLGSVGTSAKFKEQMSRYKNDLEKTVSVKVTPEQFERVKAVGEQMGRLLVKASIPYDERQLNIFKDIIELKDADLIEAIDVAYPSAGVLKMSYSAYCATVNDYIMALNLMIRTASDVRKSIAKIISWSNNVDKLMISYLSKDLKAILAAENEVLKPGGLIIADTGNGDGERVDSTQTLDYDKLFVNKHPIIGTALMAYRLKVGEIRKNYKIIDRINVGLKALGIQNRI